MTELHEEFQQITRTIAIIKGMIRTNCAQIRILHENNKTCRDAIKHWTEVRRALIFPREKE
jgi:hypothetical protein